MNTSPHKLPEPPGSSSRRRQGSLEPNVGLDADGFSSNTYDEYVYSSVQEEPIPQSSRAYWQTVFFAAVVIGCGSFVLSAALTLAVINGAIDFKPAAIKALFKPAKVKS